MSSFPNNHPWGHTNNGALNNQTNQPVGLHGGQQVNRPPYQVIIFSIKIVKIFIWINI